MSLDSIRPFFRTRLKALGFNEHFDAFDDNNRPAQSLDKTFRIDTSVATGTSANMQVHEFEMSVNLLITLKGKGDNNIDVSDRAWEVCGTILEDILTVDNRNGTVIKDIEPTTINVGPYSASDDNDVLMSLGFDVSLYCDFN